MSALVAVFAQAYRDTNRAIAPLQRAGIAREMLNANQAARPFWTESLDLADRLGLLPRVVEIATTDPTIAAFHRPISLAYEAHLSEQAAAGAAPAPPTPLDPGGPDEDALAAAYARGRDDERRRCTRHAQALAGRAFAGAVGYPDVLATAEAISGGKAAP
mgnify:CR=1 FL=1